MTETLEGKVALVTGAGSGIGRATSLAFAKQGASVVVSDMSVAAGEEAVDMIKEAGGEAVFTKADVSNSAEVEVMVKKALESYGRLDYAHNNAGIEEIRCLPTADCTEENWNRVISVNLTGVWLCMRYEIPRMLKQGSGAIVNTSSAVGLVAMKDRPAYVASKHGVVGLTKAAALEYAEAGIRVNAVMPGPTHTSMIERASGGDPRILAERYASGVPMRRIGKPEEIAEAVVWLCSDAASFITGHTLVVDGGWVAQ